MERVLECSTPHHERVFVVAGNHDADWEDVDTANAGAGSDDEGALEWESD